MGTAVRGAAGMAFCTPSSPTQISAPAACRELFLMVAVWGIISSAVGECPRRCRMPHGNQMPLGMQGHARTLALPFPTALCSALGLPYLLTFYTVGESKKPTLTKRKSQH